MRSTRDPIVMLVVMEVLDKVTEVNEDMPRVLKTLNLRVLKLKSGETPEVFDEGQLKKVLESLRRFEGPLSQLSSLLLWLQQFNAPRALI